MCANQVGAMFGLFFTNADTVSNFQQATECNIEQFKTFFHGMLDNGVYLAPSAYEAGFVSSAHSEADLQKTIDVAETVLNTLK